MSGKSGKKPKANDYLSLIFSDMVYEDFYNGKKENGGDESSTLEEIFLNSSKTRFKDDPKYRKNRLRVNYTEYDELSNWEFLRKSGNNNVERQNSSSSWIVKKLMSEAKNPDFLSEVIKKIPLLPLVYQLGDNSLSIAKHMSVSNNFLSYFLLDKCQDKIHNMLDKISREADKFLEEDLGTDSGFYAAAFINKADKEIIIAYRGTNQTEEDHGMTNSLIAAGIPSEQFYRAKEFYKDTIEEPEYQNYSFTFTGHSLAGGLAQYAAVMAQRNGHPVYCKAWNGIGVDHFRNFYGNEFLGYGDTFLFLINKIFRGEKNLRDAIDKRIYREIQEADIIQGTSINPELIKRDKNGIPQIAKTKFIKMIIKQRIITINKAVDKVEELVVEIDEAKKELAAVEKELEEAENRNIEVARQAYSNVKNNKLLQNNSDKIDKIKNDLIEAGYQQFEVLDRGEFITQLLVLRANYKQALRYDQFIEDKGLSLIMPDERAEKLKKTAFKIANRKLRFAEKYKKADKTNIQNYSNSYDVTGTIFKHVGNCYLVDRNFEKNTAIDYSSLIEKGSLTKGANEIGREELKIARQHGVGLFYPYMLIEPNGNVGSPKSMQGGNKVNAEVGDVTNRLSYDYLRSIIKTMMLDITDDKTDTEKLKDIYMIGKSENRKQTEKKFQKNLVKVCKALLLNSMKQQDRKLVKKNNLEQDLNEDWIEIHKTNVESIFKIVIVVNKKLSLGMQKMYSSKVILDDSNINYRLDTAIVNNLQEMSGEEIKKLWNWKSNKEKKKLLVGTKDITKKEHETIYHGLNLFSFDVTNRYQEIEFEIEFKPNKDALYGSMIDRSNQDVVKTDEELFAYQSGYGAKEEYEGNKHPTGAEIKLEEEKIGTKIKIKDLSPNNHSSLQYQEKIYGEYSIQKGTREEKLRLTYNYYKEKDLLKINYGEQDELSIIDFKNGDYKIQLPIPLLGVDYEGSITNPTLIKKTSKLSSSLNLKEVRFKGRGKIKINGEYLKALNIKSIGKKDNSKDYQDQAGYKYYKKDNNLHISYKNKEGNPETLCIVDFVEGDYGLWIEEEAPYYVEGSNLVAYYDSWNDSQSEVIQLEENQFLEEEERIKHQFLWIYPEDEIKQPEKDEKIISSVTKTKTQKDNKQQSDNKPQTQETKSKVKNRNPDFRAKQKLITGLNKTSSVSEIEQAANIVISEARRKRKPLIAQSLEDYLAGMQLKKKIAADKLKTLDAIKTAETELQLKIDEKLIWDLNDIVRYKNLFKPHEEVTFEIKYSRLVNPICRSIEEFVNASEDSILKAKGKFVLEKVLNRNKLSLKGKLTYKWENDYIWRVGRKKLLHSYGFIDDYLFKKLATQGTARPYKMYSKWSYYLSDSLSLVKKDVDTMRKWHWHDFAMFEHI